MARYKLCILDRMSRVIDERELDCAGDTQAWHRANLIGGNSRWELWRAGVRINSPRPNDSSTLSFLEAANG